MNKHPAFYIALEQELEKTSGPLTTGLIGSGIGAAYSGLTRKVDPATGKKPSLAKAMGKGALIGGAVGTGGHYVAGKAKDKAISLVKELGTHAGNSAGEAFVPHVVRAGKSAAEEFGHQATRAGKSAGEEFGHQAVNSGTKAVKDKIKSGLNRVKHALTPEYPTLRRAPIFKHILNDPPKVASVLEKQALNPLATALPAAKNFLASSPLARSTLKGAAEGALGGVLDRKVNPETGEKEGLGKSMARGAAVGGVIGGGLHAASNLKLPSKKQPRELKVKQPKTTSAQFAQGPQKTTMFGNVVPEKNSFSMAPTHHPIHGKAEHVTPAMQAPSAPKGPAFEIDQTKSTRSLGSVNRGAISARQNLEAAAAALAAKKKTASLTHELAAIGAIGGGLLGSAARPSIDYNTGMPLRRSQRVFDTTVGSALGAISGAYLSKQLLKGVKK